MSGPNHSKREEELTRRTFLKLASGALAAGAAVPTLSFENLAMAASLADDGKKREEETASLKVRGGQRLLTGWEYHHWGLGGIWEVWREASDRRPWQAVELPHCFNAYDAVDADTPYYQGPWWYRTRMRIENPYPNGRTLLHFEGAGQKSEIYVYTQKVASHIGGYDEFTVDITDAAAKFLKEPTRKGIVPLAVMCDNSRDLEMVPSNLSDFTLYGGLYRYVNLVYAPAISLERVHIDSSVDLKGKAAVSVQARLYNPSGLKDEVQVGIQVVDPMGKVVYSASRALAPWSGLKELSTLTITPPLLWSPHSPSLYRCVVLLKSVTGESRVVERFGLRTFEFVKHGPFKLNGEKLLLRGTHRH